MDLDIFQETPVAELAPKSSLPAIFGAGTQWPLHVVDDKNLRIWVKFDEEFQVEMLSDWPAELQHHEVGFEIDQMGIDDLVISCELGRSIQVAGVYLYYYREQWAMENGLIPGQPFQVEIYCHHYTSQTQDGAEHDCDMEVKVVTKAPIDLLATAEFWATWLKGFEELKQRVQQEVETSRREIESRAELLKIATCWYWPSHYDEMTPPSGLRLTLFSTYTPPPGTRSINTQLASGEDNEGNWGTAFARLKAKVQEKYPQFADVELEKLPRQ